MRVLFDQGTPVPLRRLLAPHEVRTVFELGWSALANGDLLAHAEADGFQVLLTTDRRMRYQQDLSGKSIRVVVLSTTSWRRIRTTVPVILRAIAEARPATFTDVPIP